MNRTEKIGVVNGITNGTHISFDYVVSNGPITAGKPVLLSKNGVVFQTENVMQWIHRLTTDEIYIKTANKVYHSENCAGSAYKVETA